MVETAASGYGTAMRAITYTDDGGPDVLQLVDLPTSPPGPGEALVKLAWSGVNPTDWKAREGTRWARHSASRSSPRPER